MTGLRLVVMLLAAVVGLAGGAATALMNRTSDDPVTVTEPTAEDPLGLGMDMVNVPCAQKGDNAVRSLLVVGWGNNDRDLSSSKADWAGVGARYLETSQSCPAAWPFKSAKRPQYAAYLPDFASATTACEAKMQAVHKGDFVTRMLSTSGDAVPCACVMDRADLPPITEGQPMTTEAGMWTSHYQQMLAKAGLLDLVKVESGSFDKPTIEATYVLQTDNALNPTGIVDGDTWRELSNKSCSRFKF